MSSDGDQNGNSQPPTDPRFSPPGMAPVPVRPRTSSTPGWKENALQQNPHHDYVQPSYTNPSVTQPPSFPLPPTITAPQGFTTNQPSCENHSLESLPPEDRPLGSSQLAVGITVILILVFFTVGSAVVAMVTWQFVKDPQFQTASKNGSKKPDMRQPFGSDTEIKTAVNSSRGPRIPTSPGRKRYTWRRNQIVEQLSYVSSGDLMSDLDLIVRETGGDASYPDSVEAACQRLAKLDPETTTDSFERTMIFGWLIGQKFDQLFSEPLSVELINSRKHFPFFHEVVIRCYTKWGDGIEADRIWDSGLNDQRELLLDLADRFPTPNLISLLIKETTKSPRLKADILEVLSRHPLDDPTALPRSFTSIEKKQLHEAWGLTNDDLKILNELKRGRFSVVARSDASEGLRPALLRSLRYHSNKRTDENWWMCLAKYGEAEDLKLLENNFEQLNKNPAITNYALNFLFRLNTTEANQWVVLILEQHATNYSQRLQASNGNNSRNEVELFNLKPLAESLASSPELNRMIVSRAMRSLDDRRTSPFWLAIFSLCEVEKQTLSDATIRFANSESLMPDSLFDVLLGNFQPTEPAYGALVGKLLKSGDDKSVALWKSSFAKMLPTPTPEPLAAAIAPSLYSEESRRRIVLLLTSFGSDAELAVQTLLKTENDFQFEIACQTLSKTGTEKSIDLLRSLLEEFESNNIESKTRMIRYTGQQIKARGK